MKKMMRLLILFGAVLALEPEATVAASAGSCGCSWSGDYWLFVLQDPYCGSTSGGFTFEAADAGECADLCNYFATSSVHDSCGDYNCGPVPYVNHPASYSYSGCWSFSGQGQCFGPYYFQSC